MIANEDNSAWIDEATPEEKALLERSSAPTLLDLPAAAIDLFTTIAVEPDSTLSDLSGPHQSAA
jgi:hypothetical protein